MATELLLKEDSMPAADLNNHGVRCPTCGSRTLILYGASVMERTETVENGQTTDVKIDQKSHAFEIEMMECFGCCTRWHVKTDVVWALELRNEELRQLVIKATGQDPYLDGMKIH